MYLITDRHEHDSVHCPSHYDTAGIDMHLEPIDLLGRLDFLLGNAMKYLFRYKLKGKPEEDLKKARQYLEWYVSDGCVGCFDSVASELASMFLHDAPKYHPALVCLLRGIERPASMDDEAYNAMVALEKYK